jgi:DNA-binding MarR family transcriptional regulator
VPALEEIRQQNPKDTALAIFRFKARRGIGVYYTLLATIPLLLIILTFSSTPPYIAAISVAVLAPVILVFASSAGMKRFTQMRFVMNLLDQNPNASNEKHRINRLLDGARTVLIAFLPLVAAAIFAITGSAVLGSIALIAYLGYILAYYIFVFSKQPTDNVLPWRIEDWIVAVFPPILLVLGFFQAIPSSTVLVLLLLLFLLAGLKSSYQAPQEISQVLGNDSFSRQPLASKQESVSISELSSENVLSSFTRVGIMIALLGTERITFTDLMFVVGVSKSSLNYCVNALADTGYVTVRKGFKAAGGPRTFIQITDRGKVAILAHLETMKRFASEYSPRE